MNLLLRTEGMRLPALYAGRRVGNNRSLPLRGQAPSPSLSDRRDSQAERAWERGCPERSKGPASSHAGRLLVVILLVFVILRVGVQRVVLVEEQVAQPHRRV